MQTCRLTLAYICEGICFSVILFGILNFICLLTNEQQRSDNCFGFGINFLFAKVMLLTLYYTQFWLKWWRFVLHYVGEKRLSVFCFQFDGIVLDRDV